MIGAGSDVDVDSGRIILRPSLADLLACRQIPGAKWDSARKAWLFPATVQTAAIIRQQVRKLSESDRFKLLLATSVSISLDPEQSRALLAGSVVPGAVVPLPPPDVQPVTVPVPLPTPVLEPEIVVDLPDGIRTTPWRHQRAAFKFCLDHFAVGLHGLLLAMGMGCVDGDAELVINRGGGARRITLREFHRKLHGGGIGGRRWRDLPTRTRSMIDGELRLNEVIAVVAQGVKPVVRVALASGKSLRLTSDHEIAGPDGRWVPAAKLSPGDVVLTNGVAACKSCGSTNRVTTYRYAKHVGVCRSCIGRYRRVKGKCIDKDGYVRLYSMQSHPRANKAGQVYEHIVVMERVLGRAISATEHVHHKNHVRHDNSPENLEVLSALEHYRHHGRSGGYLHLDGGARVCFIPKPDSVISVEPDGETDVYDIQMAGPGHNFVANGIIVHNCGKSLVAILVLLSLKARRIMIVCPLRVVQVWVAQLERHCGVPILVAALDEDAGSVAKKQELALEKMRLAEVRGVPFVLVLNYDSAWRDPFAEWAEKLRWDLLILDEAHRIKAPSGKASLFFKRLRKMAIYRIALSGTPMPHGPMDIFGIFRAIDILIFGPSFSAFRQKYAVMGGYQRKQIVEFQRLDELERLMSRVTFRVGKEVLELPPETDVTYHCELGAEARRVYDDLEEDFVALVRDGVVTAANAMVKILRLQQVCGGIAKTDAGVEHRIDDAKQKLLADTLEDIGPGEPVVVFCWFHLDLDAVHEAARSQEFTSLELSGRKDELKQWQDGKAQVLAVQIQAGGEGVDFTRARYSIFYSVGYSLGKYEQARARTHRPGQTSPVEHIHLIARNTVDVKIMRALAKRAEVVESILAEIKN